MRCATWTFSIHSSMYPRNPPTNSPAAHGNDYEPDLSNTLGYLAIDTRTESKSDPKFGGGLASGYLQTPPKPSRPSPPPSLRPGNGRVFPPRRQSSGGVAFPVPMHVSPPPPVLYGYTPFQMPTPARGDS